MLTHWGIGGVQTFLQESESTAAKQNPIVDLDISLQRIFQP